MINFKNLPYAIKELSDYFTPEEIIKLNIRRIISEQNNFDNRVVFSIDDYKQREFVFLKSIAHHNEKYIIYPGLYYLCNTIFNINNINNKEIVIYCEGILDYYKIKLLGYDNIITTGFCGFTDFHKKIILEHDIKNIFVLFDFDGCGVVAAKNIEDNLSNKIKITNGTTSGLFFENKLPQHSIYKIPNLLLKDFINKNIF